MTKIALISDVHANLEALEAVLAHIDAQRDIKAIYCLGDVVGYGPDPSAVIDLIRNRCAWSLMGNHDYAMLNSLERFNATAAGAIRCQRREMDPGVDESQAGVFVHFKRARRWNFLQTMKMQVRRGDSLFVHGSPRDLLFEYLFPDDYDHAPEKLRKNFGMIRRICYVGHTHQPGVFPENAKFISPKECNMEYRLRRAEKTIVNVGSVGQPRDRDPRACYVTVSKGLIQWHRVEYDIERTIAKVRANSCLDVKCGLRLREGL